MKFFIKFLCLFLCANLSLSELLCPQKKEPPQEIENNPSFTLEPIIKDSVLYETIQISNQIFLNKDHSRINKKTTALYEDSLFCPNDFIIPKKEHYELIISQLGANAYSTFTDPNGFNMQRGKYYLTNTKGKEKNTQNKMFMYLDGTNIKFIDYDPFSANTVCRCMLDLSGIKLLFPEIIGDPILNQNTKIAINREKYVKGFLWKIGDEKFTNNEITYKFKKSGMHMVEFWGNYINGETLYLCENVFVKRAQITNSQDDTFSDENIKKIETDFEMQYSVQLHYHHSNSPVAPRIDGGYYIAFTDKNSYLHVLSYDKNDNLKNDFNTTEKAFPIDITSTDYGFAIYILEAGSDYHSYLSVYNKNFELVNTVQIMNNSKNDDNTISNLQKQIIQFDETRNPVFGMNFMYEPKTGKLVYSRGRIFLIFCHYNHFIDGRGDHTGDTVVTFNDILTDMDFGITWGTSHSLILSATFDENYFWTAALGDANPYGIRVEYTSKKEFSNNFYDPIHKKYNSRIKSFNDALAGYINGYRNGKADGRLGGILYFSELGLYCLVYAKTPDVDSGKHVIYMTTWKFIDNQITNNQTYIIKTIESNHVLQVRAGRYGKDKVFIIYYEDIPKNSTFGYIHKGSIPKLYIIKLPEISKIVDDIAYDKLLMNTNEDLRTFEDGVLIWATSNTDGKLYINKIGQSRLSESNDDIEYKLTKEDLIYYLNTHENITDEFVNEENKNIETEKNGDLSGGAIAGIAIGSVCGAGGIGIGVFFLLRYFKNKNLTPQTPEIITQTKVDVTRFSNSRNNVNSKSSVNNSTTIRSKGKGKLKGKVKKKRKSVNK